MQVRLAAAVVGAGAAGVGVAVELSRGNPYRGAQRLPNLPRKRVPRPLSLRQECVPRKLRHPLRPVQPLRVPQKV